MHRNTAKINFKTETFKTYNKTQTFKIYYYTLSTVKF